MSKCSCGRSPTGLCIGWHSLTEEKYKEKKKKYDELKEEEKNKLLQYESKPLYNHRKIHIGDIKIAMKN